MCWCSTKLTNIIEKSSKISILYSGNNQITFARAQDEFGITEADVAHLSPKIMRSPYEDGESIKVYLEDDILKIIKYKLQYTNLKKILKTNIKWFKKIY